MLSELHTQGHPVILVTHDPNVAAHANRVIEVQDGRIVSDSATTDTRALITATAIEPESAPPRARTSVRVTNMLESFGMALRSMMAHTLRTLLTMLGIIIGIASVVSVVSVVALGAGAKQRILADISSIGTSTIEIMPGTGPGDQLADTVQSLVAEDAEAIAALPYVDSAAPTLTASGALSHGGTEALATINGVGWQFFRVRGTGLIEGDAFSAQHVQQLAQVAVIDAATRDRLFPQQRHVVGEVILVGGVPVMILGVAKPESGMVAGASLNIWVPYTTATGRLGNSKVNSLTVRLRADVDGDTAEAGIAQLPVRRHGIKDFFLSSSGAIRQMIEKTTRSITLLISSIAVISLLVGGIGVMNIILVSVTERIQEIGVRLAVGARQSDILAQFLIEATLVCLIGGAMGVALAFGLSGLVALLDLGIRMIISPIAVAGAVAVSSAIGIGFGFLPARNASRLDPVQALSAR